LLHVSTQDDKPARLCYGPLTHITPDEPVMSINTGKASSAMPSPSARLA